jgi:hypothetical protein
MRIKNSLIFFSSLVFILNSCDESPTENEFKYPPDNEHRVTISQGVWGNVWFWEGNFMPVIDPNYAKITPVVRDIYIYEATTDSNVQYLNGNFGTFITKINSNLITTIHSDNDGFFQISLSPGKYSFFVKEDTLFYANEWDGEGHILSAIVTENNVSRRQIDITYKAVF